MAGDMGRRNTVSVDIRSVARLLGRGTPISFVRGDSLRRLPRRDPDQFWRAFYTVFPGSKGLVTVSRPGISADGRRAVIGIGISCGVVAAHGAMQLCRRMAIDGG
jgi:hypothetical protein